MLLLNTSLTVEQARDLVLSADELRFRDELTQSQIADRIGCSQMQVSRRLRSILDSMNRQVAGTPAK